MEDIDLDIVRAVRATIGNARLRLDANESWDMLQARRMFEKLQPFDIEFIEQPLPAPLGAAGLANLRAITRIPIAADQANYSPEDVFAVCASRAADVITLGLHETGGVRRRSPKPCDRGSDVDVAT